MKSKITPFLWFEKDADAAIEYYTSIFKDAKKGPINRMPDGQVITGSFELLGQEFMILQGGPASFKFNESISFFVSCKDQAEVDYYWDNLTADGGEESRCGWLKDKYGLSWQIVPEALGTCLGDPDPEKAQRAMKAMMGMKKLIVADLENARDGK
ncbi:VOC family protein [Candidatus Microgenomates bacterium]|nr:VOC family protein [Candidatus Microgenomates bacterium]